MYACKYFTFLMCRVPTSVYEAETISIYCGFICKTFYHMDTFSTWCKDNDIYIYVECISIQSTFVARLACLRETGKHQQ